MNNLFMTRKCINDKFLNLIEKIEKRKKTQQKHVIRQTIFVLILNHSKNHLILASISALREIGESRN